jgi:hypothetical protein
MNDDFEYETLGTNLKPLKLAHEDLMVSLREYMRALKSFEDESAGHEGQYMPHDDTPERIDKSAYSICFAMTYLSLIIQNLERDKDLVLIQMQDSHRYIDKASKEIACALFDELDTILYYCEDAMVFLSWQAVCGAIYSFARSAAQELADFHLKYSGLFDRSFFSALFSAVWSLNETANAAIECRKKGIGVHLNGPLSQYALEDARAMGGLIRHRAGDSLSFLLQKS